MHTLNKIRQYENLHIVFWLIKDTCWMLELKLFGAIMIVPTVLLCMWIIYKTRTSLDVYINLAILFWIAANSFWMLTEFFGDVANKHYAGIPFAIGFIFVGIFGLKWWKSRGSDEEIA
jgi:hypothetical protein